MTVRSIVPVVALGIVLSLTRQDVAQAAGYEETVQAAEQLWQEGRKVEAVQTYGGVWKLSPKDFDRLILYGERSAEIGNYKWSLNFYKAAESQALGDSTVLYKAYTGYGKTYRLMGYPNRAQPYEDKAADLLASGKVKGVDQERPTSLGHYTEPGAAAAAVGAEPAAGTTGKPEQAPASVKVVREPRRFLKKRIAVSPIEVAIASAGMGDYGRQISAMLETELRKTDRFIVVEREDLKGILAEQDLAASGRVAKGSGPETGRLMGAQLMVKAQITDFEDQSAQGRSIGVGPVDVGRGRSVIRVAMDMRIYDAESGVVVAAEGVAAEKVRSTQDLGINVSVFRWDDSRQQNSTLGVVTRDLVQKALGRIIATSEKVPWTARVMKESEGRVYFNAGLEANIGKGDRFKIMSVGEALTDPDTGAVLATEDKEVAEIETMRVEEKYSIGYVVKKAGEIKRLDKVVALPSAAPREKTEKTPE